MLDVRESGLPDVKPYWHSLPTNDPRPYVSDGHGHPIGRPDCCYPRKPLQLCPLLTVRHKPAESSAERHYRSGRDEVTELPHDLPMQPKTATWRDMYLIDPPRTSVQVAIDWRVGESSPYSFAGSGRHQHTVSGAEGLTFGEMVESLLKMKTTARHKDWIVHESIKPPVFYTIRGVLHLKTDRGRPGWHLPPLEKKHGVGAMTHAERSWFRFDRTVFPEESEWATLDSQRGARATASLAMSSCTGTSG